MESKEFNEPNQPQWSSIEAGQIRNGVVSGVEDFGVFVDLGEHEGLITLLEIAWKRFDDPLRVVSVGQEVAVLVLGIDLKRERISLSLKALDPDPMKEFARRNIGQTVTGRVTQINPIGIFVQVEEGLEGLIVDTPGPASGGGRALQAGDDVFVKVLSVNIYNRQISLSIQSSHA